MLTLNEMLEGKEFELKNNVTNMPSGLMTIDNLSVIEKPTFVDYLRSGWQINLHIAIDFTGSNGDPRD